MRARTRGVCACVAWRRASGDACYCKCMTYNLRYMHTLRPSECVTLTQLGPCLAGMCWEPRVVVRLFEGFFRPPVVN
jgi:hypothetical protein